ncbi:MAG TPA: YfjI family protein [Verrucomicrobiae bacterium]|nr:YfjI family protein [Verrucomicrobiae bacterium]
MNAANETLPETQLPKVETASREDRNAKTKPAHAPTPKLTSPAVNQERAGVFNPTPQETFEPEESENETATSPVLQFEPPPINRLPEPLAEYVTKAAESIGCDPCLVIMPALAACAAAIGDSRAVQIKPGWNEWPILWTKVIAASGTLKTPAMKAAMRGLEEAQRKAFEKCNLAEAQHKADIADWIKRGREGVEPSPPKLESYYIGDATLEAVCGLLDANPRGLLQKRDELSGWLGGFDKYSEGNEAAQWLEAHSGNPIRVDRKGGDKKNLYIPHGLISVTGTIQEPVLRKMLTGEDAQHFDNGLAARFLMAMPPERARRWSEAIIPPALTQKYEELFSDLLALKPEIEADTGRRSPALVTWAPETKRRFVEFVNANGKEILSCKNSRLKSAWSKLEGQAARIALVFHCVREAHLPSPGDGAKMISADTLDAALAWIEWLKNETRRIYYTLAHAGDVRQADKLLDFAQRNGGQITARDAARNGAGGRSADEVESVMCGLVAAGLAEWFSPEQPKGGRPTRYFRLKQSLPTPRN